MKLSEMFEVESKMFWGVSRALKGKIYGAKQL